MLIAGRPSPEVDDAYCVFLHPPNFQKTWKYYPNFREMYKFIPPFSFSGLIYVFLLPTPILAMMHFG